MYRRFGLEPPEPPKYDYDIQMIIDVFYMAARGRRYVEGQPLPLSVRDITDVVTVHPIPVPRCVLDPVIFALDDKELEISRKKSKVVAK